MKTTTCKSRGINLAVLEVEVTSKLKARYMELLETARYNLNGAPDNAVAEALALAAIYKKGHVLAERDLVRCSGYGDMVPGTPDGATVLSSGGLAATQVVRAGRTRGRGAVRALLETLLIKVYKSLRWLTDSGIGDTVCSFLIAAWVPSRLSTKAIASLKSMLRRVGDIDRRFEVVLLVPPKHVRAEIFPPKFGSHLISESTTAEEDRRGLDQLLSRIHAYSGLWQLARVQSPGSNANDEGTELGFLELLFATEAI